MKEIIKEFLELLGYFVLVVSLVFASYMLLINLYHYKEVNITQTRNFATDVNYNDFLEKLDRVEKNVDSVKTGVPAAVTVKQGFNSCIKSIKESKFYGLKENNTYGIKEIYDINRELYNDLNNRCLYSVPYYINAMSLNSYDSIKDDIQFQKNRISENANYVISQSLGNSAYNYTTTITRQTIYNDLVQKMTFTIGNYDNLMNIVLELSNWYVDEFGGVR